MASRRFVDGCVRVLMGGTALATDCTFCDPPRRAYYVLHDGLTDQTVDVCRAHYIALAKLKGFHEDDADPDPHDDIRLSELEGLFA